MSKKIALSSNTSKSSLPSSAAADIVASNPDLLIEILIRVPAKALIKLKSVSKQWLSLISDSQFLRNHTTHHNPLTLPSALFLYSKRGHSLPLNDQITRVSVNGRPQTSLPNFSFLDGLGSVTELHYSSNGLMLCSIGGLLGKDYVVCNLTTQKFVRLPTLTPVSNLYHIQSYLVFYPKKSPYYKVVVIILAFDSYTTQLAVYSSESGSWKTTTLGPQSRDLGTTRGALWNGAIIVISAGHDHFYFRFDIEAEKLTTIRVPPVDNNQSEGETMYFGECEGRCFLIQIFKYNATEFRVLELIDGETNFRWTVKYIVDLTPLILPKRKSCRFKVISVMKVGANDSDLAVVFYIRGKIVQYNIERKTLKVLCDFTEGKFPAYNMYSCHFIASLTPI